MPFSSNRRVAVTLAALGFAVSACGEGTTLPTTLDPLEMQQDVAVSQAAFDYPATNALGDLGWAMDEALMDFGGLSLRLPTAMLREGPRRPLERHHDRVVAMLAHEEPAAIPITALGKTFVWDVNTDRYVESNRTGAPVTGVRFILYETEDDVALPKIPLVEVGYVEITRESSGQTLVARVKVVATGGATVMEYTASVSGASNATSFSLAGTAGVGSNRLTFTLTLGVNVITGNVTAIWNTSIAARGLSSRVQLGIGQSAFTLGGVMQRGLRKVEMGGTLNYTTGGRVTVRVGNKVFAYIDYDGSEDEATVTNAQGAPLTPEDEDTLFAILEWFYASFAIPDALLAPLYTVLEVN